MAGMKFRWPLGAVAALALGACASTNVHRGAVIDSEFASAVQPGIDNKDSVEKLLGRPTFTGQFSPNDWYYVSRDTQGLAFREPHITRQRVLLVRFDPAGNVTDIRNGGKELVMNVGPAGRRTPTLGRKRSFFEEFFGGIGSVNSGGVPGQ